MHTSLLRIAITRVVAVFIVDKVILRRHVITAVTQTITSGGNKGRIVRVAGAKL